MSIIDRGCIRVGTDLVLQCWLRALQWRGGGIAGSDHAQACQVWSIAKVSDHRSSTIGVILRAWPINRISTVSTE